MNCLQTHASVKKLACDGRQVPRVVVGSVGRRERGARRNNWGRGRAKEGAKEKGREATERAQKRVLHCHAPPLSTTAPWVGQDLSKDTRSNHPVDTVWDWRLRSKRVLKRYQHAVGVRRAAQSIWVTDGQGPKGRRARRRLPCNTSETHLTARVHAELRSAKIDGADPGLRPGHKHGIRQTAWERGTCSAEAERCQPPPALRNPSLQLHTPPVAAACV
eukprot:3215560-Pleurochrysis_carterae.AAC.2